jgi:hypothetical protein
MIIPLDYTRKYVCEFYFFCDADEGTTATAIVADVVLTIFKLNFCMEAWYELV